MLGTGKQAHWIQKKLKKKPSRKEQKVDDTAANTREEENTNRKIQHNNCILDGDG